MLTRFPESGLQAVNRLKPLLHIIGSFQAEEGRMGFLDSIKRMFGGGPGRATADDNARTFYVQCGRCREPLKGRIDLRNELSQDEDGEGWVVRKGLMGDGSNRCFQTVEAILTLDSGKKNIINSEVIGGKLITAEEYEALLQQKQGAENA
jgi:hypothetical protein